MNDKIIELANIITNYSIEVKKDDVVYICACTSSKLLVNELIKNIYSKEAYPIIKYTDEQTDATILKDANKSSLEKTLSYNKKILEELDCYINIRTRESENVFFDVSQDLININNSLQSEFTNNIIQNKRWVLLEWPSKYIAKKANMSEEECFEFMLKACTADFAKISYIGNKLKNVIQNTDIVKILASETNLELSIKDSEVVVTDGKYNLPDGETACAPVINSINGYIKFNTPSVYNGIVFNNVKLEFKDGKVVDATSDNNQDELNEILNIDDGARYVGEFAFGLNDNVTKPLGSALYDEKIVGSIHLALGKSLPGMCDNKNRSLIHWDLVQIQRKDYGGGKIYFDDNIIMEDGILNL